MSPGLFLTLEGIEGAGKSTIARLVGSWLTRHGVAVRLTREPGGTPLAEHVRRIVLERGTETVSPVTETLLMFAARALHVENLIRPALARGEWVVCDRFTDATRAYQGGGRAVDLDLIEALARSVHGDLEPDCTLLLDLPVEAGLARARARPGAPGAADRFEGESVAFFDKVRAAYRALAAREPQRIRVVDAAAPLAEVERRVTEILAELRTRREHR
jgi:dTMP kinase